MPSDPSTYDVAVGSKLSFKYNTYHNVWLLPSQTAFDSCDFSGATELASTSAGGGEGDVTNLYEAIATESGTLYVACEISGHCQSDQKIEITVTPAAPSTPPGVINSPPPTSPPDDSAAAGGWASPASLAIAFAAAVALRSQMSSA